MQGSQCSNSEPGMAREVQPHRPSTCRSNMALAASKDKTSFKYMTGVDSSTFPEQLIVPLTTRVRTGMLLLLLLRGGRAGVFMNGTRLPQPRRILARFRDIFEGANDHWLLETPLLLARTTCFVFFFFSFLLLTFVLRN